MDSVSASVYVTRPDHASFCVYDSSSLIIVDSYDALLDGDGNDLIEVSTNPVSLPLAGITATGPSNIFEDATVELTIRRHQVHEGGAHQMGVQVRYLQRNGPDLEDGPGQGDHVVRYLEMYAPF